jgi:hypothetical protein
MKQTIRKMQKECLEGKLGVVDTVHAIDEAINGITKVVYKEGSKFKIHNHTAIYSLDVRGVKKKYLSALHGLAVVAYDKAQKNGSMFPGELHISKQASTKHHRDGIYEILNQYQRAA